MFAAPGGYRLGIDLGTSNTVAVLGYPTGRLAVLLFDASPTLPSAVCLDATGRFLTGHDAVHAGRVNPTGFEPNPKRLVDEGSVLLGQTEVAVAQLLSAVLSRVEAEARRVAGTPIGEVTLTFPAAWAAPRRSVLQDAAARAGLTNVRLIPEPVAAAQYFLGTGRAQLPPGAGAVVYDLGGGTFDATVIRRTPGGFEVLATEGLSQAGGLDIDAAIVSYLGSVYGEQAGPAWQRLLQPGDATQRRVSRQFWDDVRTAKETLSRNATTAIHLPVLERDAPLGREQLEQLARPILAATVSSTMAAVRASGLPAGAITAVFLVGGGSRLPLVATLLSQALGLTPIALEQPELVVAQGSLTALAPPAPATPPPGQPVSAAPYPVSGAPSAGVPLPIPGGRQPAGGAAHPVSVPPRPVTAPPGYPVPTWQPGRPVSPPPPPRAVFVGPPVPPTAPPRKRRRFPLWLRITLIPVLIASLSGAAIWHLRSNRPAAVPHVDIQTNQSINRLALSPDGKIVAIVVPTGVEFWDPATKSRIPKRINNPANIRNLIFAPDGKRLLLADSYSITSWELSDTNQYTGSIDLQSVTDLAASADGTKLAAVTSEGAYAWARPSGALLFQPSGRDLPFSNAVAFGHGGASIFLDERVMVSGEVEHRVMERNATTGALIGEPLAGGPAEVTDIAVSPDGRTVATVADDRTLRLWDATTHKLLQRLLVSRYSLVGVSFSADGSRLVTSSGTDVLVYSTVTGKQVATLGLGGSAFAPAAIAPDNRTVVSFFGERIRVWTLPADLTTPAPSGAPSSSG